jgi:hypothetical protein
MFPPVESQVIFLSKEIPIVSVGLRTAEVPYTNQKQNGLKIEVGQMVIQLESGEKIFIPVSHSGENKNKEK